MSEVQQWLCGMNLQNYVDKFKAENYTDLSMIKKMDDINIRLLIKHVGIRGCDKSVLRRGIKKLNMPAGVLRETYKFACHNDDPWGIAINFSSNWSEWVLIRIDRGKQAGRLGLKLGDKLISINDMPISDSNYHEFKRMLMHGSPCSPTFERRQKRTEEKDHHEQHHHQHDHQDSSQVHHQHQYQKRPDHQHNHQAPSQLQHQHSFQKPPEKHHQHSFQKPPEKHHQYDHQHQYNRQHHDHVHRTESHKTHHQHHHRQQVVPNYKDDGRLSEKTFKFHDNNEDPWGVKVNLSHSWEQWRVIAIASGMQAERLGVRVDDSIVAINGVSIDDLNNKEMNMQLKKGFRCSLTFKRKQKHPEKQDHHHQHHHQAPPQVQHHHRYQKRPDHQHDHQAQSQAHHQHHFQKPPERQRQHDHPHQYDRQKHDHFQPSESQKIRHQSHQQQVAPNHKDDGKMTETTYPFDDNAQDPWGIKVNLSHHWNEWRVISITKGKQAERLALRVGDKIISINGISIDDTNYNEMKLKLTKGFKCSLTFRGKAKHKDQQSQYHHQHHHHRPPQQHHHHYHDSHHEQRHHLHKHQHHHKQHQPHRQQQQHRHLHQHKHQNHHQRQERPGNKKTEQRKRKLQKKLKKKKKHKNQRTGGKVYAVGQRVEVRDEGEAWQPGTVSIGGNNPYVKKDGMGIPYIWEEIRMV